MKTFIKSILFLITGLFAFSCSMSQKTASEYDDIYYMPSKDKVAPVAAVKQEPVTQESATYEPDDYEKYISSLEKRNIIQKIDFEKLDGSCLLCSEHKPDMCHRRLLAEYLKKANKEIEIIHLIK